MNIMFKGYQRILILAPHTDDGELGLGGTVAMLTESGKDVYYAAFSTCEESVPSEYPSDILTKELMMATDILGIPSKNVMIYDYKVRNFSSSRQNILDDMISLRNTCKPDLVFIPSLNDVHQDHSTIASEGVRAFKNITLLGYDLIWNKLECKNVVFCQLDEHHIQKKHEALYQYRSQGSRAYMSKEFVFGQAVTRGVQVGLKYAESFEVIRWIVK